MIGAWTLFSSSESEIFQFYLIISGYYSIQCISVNDNGTVYEVTNYKTEILTTLTSRCQLFLFPETTHILQKPFRYAILTELEPFTKSCPRCFCLRACLTG